ncbi:DUF481 domain-containing protein [Pseudenhygromyxa sp. WMMC2535]|uniref:DUF481 domain-containing protein n=1 Tax=Pseudenhygromyxa sp. WMMC2535 TaxID=2712867 RepID=UPI001554F0B8|nr:DUF481 domain-containing protein [Pseudenhygromyxa sp. WMMC2535]NVB41221.1 DUF481 domain-containing protein [Pseudenhygromyxa sp. WMMC2535]
MNASTLPRLVLPTLCGLSLALLAGSALAASPEEDPNVPKGTASQSDASSGSTELGTGDKFSTAKQLPADEAAAAEGEAGEPDPHANDVTEFDIALGGIFNTGNSRAMAGTALTNFRLRRTIHQFTAQAAGNIGAQGMEDDNGDPDGYEKSVANVQALARYDVFFAERWTAFLQATVRHDRFQSLDLRLNVDPGVAFYALNKPKHRLWFEAGYDFQYDLRYTEGPELDGQQILLDGMGDQVTSEVDDGMGGTTTEPTYVDPYLVNHAVRLYAGYSNKLSDKVSFDTGLEYLQSVIVAKRFRLNYLAALNTQLFERLSLAVTFTLRYENDPLPDVLRLDTITAVSLAYRFF